MPSKCQKQWIRTLTGIISVVLEKREFENRERSTLMTTRGWFDILRFDWKHQNLKVLYTRCFFKVGKLYLRKEIRPVFPTESEFEYQEK